MGKKIKVGLIGIGNCFSGLIQGIEFYAQNPSQSITGIIHEKLRDYGIHDIEFVCGFDVGENKGWKEDKRSNIRKAQHGKLDSKRIHAKD